MPAAWPNWSASSSIRRSRSRAARARPSAPCWLHDQGSLPSAAISRTRSDRCSRNMGCSSAGRSDHSSGGLIADGHQLAPVVDTATKAIRRDRRQRSCVALVRSPTAGLPLRSGQRAHAPNAEMVGAEGLGHASLTTDRPEKSKGRSRPQDRCAAYCIWVDGTTFEWGTEKWPDLLTPSHVLLRSAENGS